LSGPDSIDRGGNLIRVSRSRHVTKRWQIGDASATNRPIDQLVLIVADIDATCRF